MMLERDTRPVSGPEVQTVFQNPAPATVVQTPSPRKPTPIDVATLLINARVLVKNGEANLALNLLRTASNRDSKNPVVLKLLADILEQTGRHEESLKVRAAYVRYASGFEATFAFAQALYRAGRDEEALNAYYETLSHVTEENPALFEVHKNMGNIFVRRGDFESAEECYNKAHTMNPESDALMVNFGTLEVQRNDLGRSLECFRKAVAINSSNDRAWTGLAMAHDAFSDFELAWGDLERALDLNPRNRTAVILAAMWAQRDCTPQRAISRLQDYLSSDEGDDEISLALVNLFCAAGRVDLATLETGRVLAWNPGRTDVRELFNKLQGEQGAA